MRQKQKDTLQNFLESGHNYKMQFYRNGQKAAQRKQNSSGNHLVLPVTQKEQSPILLIIFQLHCNHKYSFTFSNCITVANTQKQKSSITTTMTFTLKFVMRVIKRNVKETAKKSVVGAQRRTNAYKCFDQGFKCFARYLAWGWQPFVFSLNLKHDLTVGILLPLYKHIFTNVSNSGQDFKTRGSGSWEKKPGKTQVFSGFVMNAILSDKTQYHCEITTVGPCTIYYRSIN